MATANDAFMQLSSATKQLCGTFAVRKSPFSALRYGVLRCLFELVDLTCMTSVAIKEKSHKLIVFGVRYQSYYFKLNPEK